MELPETVNKNHLLPVAYCFIELGAVFAYRDVDKDSLIGHIPPEDFNPKVGKDTTVTINKVKYLIKVVANARFVAVSFNTKLTIRQ